MKIAIAGYGAEGKVNYAYWNTPGNSVTIVDEREWIEDVPEGVPTILGEGAFSKLTDFNLVIRTASLPPHRIKTNGTIWSATNEFLAKCPAPIVGVTGTKGKGTTSSLIASILRAAGKTIPLVGNIGVPALSELPKITANDLVVFEMSSFQLWDVTKSPHVAVVLMIEPDHLNVHKDFDDYVGAKAHIRRFQTLEDICIYHPTNPDSRRIALTGPHFTDDTARATWESTAKRYAIADDGQAYVRGGAFYIGDQRICATEALQLPGAHNLDNACAAISAAWNYTKDANAIENGLRAFQGLEHRLKYVAEIDGVTYYDDSIATTPGSAIAAIRAFDEPKVIILGGSDKGSDYDEVIQLCRDTRTTVVAVGETGPRIASLCEQQGVECSTVADGTMKDIVARAREVAPSGSVVLLSPASASFDMFRSYSDRGDQFIAAVQALSS